MKRRLCWPKQQLNVLSLSPASRSLDINLFMSFLEKSDPVGDSSFHFSATIGSVSKGRMCRPPVHNLIRLSKPERPVERRKLRSLLSCAGKGQVQTRGVVLFGNQNDGFLA